MKRNINWGFYPESPIKTHSVIEIILVIVIFVGCLRLFIQWYRVPEREIVINVEDLDKKYTNQLLPGSDFNPESKYCNIYYNELQTFDESKTDSSKEDLIIHFHKFKPYFKYNDLRSSYIMLDRFKRDVNKFQDDFEFKNQQALSNFLLENVGKEDAQYLEDNKDDFVAIEAKYIDSLRTFCYNNFIKEGCPSVDYIKYSRKEKYGKYSTKTSDFKTSSASYSRTGACEEGDWCEIYRLFSLQSYYSHKVYSNNSWYHFFNPSAHTEIPNIITGWDISQSYYKFKVKSITVDSMNIKIDFKGASEFSRIFPEPDEIGFSYISYSDPQKISLLKQDGIEFLVKFKELEGVQQIRLFAMTGIMGGLFTVLIFFIFLYPTKIFRQYKVIRSQMEEEKQQKDKTKKEESANEKVFLISTEDKSEVENNNQYK